MPNKTENFDLINIDRDQVALDSIDKSAKSLAYSSTKIQAFTTLKKETLDYPPKAGTITPRQIKVSDFRSHYDRGYLLILVQQERGTTIKWKDPNFKKFNFQ